MIVVPPVAFPPPILLAAGLAVLCVIADCCLKRASGAAQPFTSLDFLLGSSLYAASAAGWVPLLRETKLATIGAVYSVVVIVLLTAIGTLWYGETLSHTETLGVLLAIVATVLLAGRH